MPPPGWQALAGFGGRPMARLGRYLTGDFLVTFGMAVLLVTFSMCIGALYQAVDVMARGIGVEVVMFFFLNNIPYTLSYSIPISALFSTLLLFGRLSSDSELDAMRSSGLSIWQIASPMVLAAVLLSAFCLYNNSFIFPHTEYASRQLIRNLGVEDPVKLLDEGRFIRDFPGYMIYVGKKRGNRVKDLIVYEINEMDGSISSSIQSKEGVIQVDESTKELRIDLFNVRIEVPDAERPEDATKTRYLSAKTFPVRLDISTMTKGSSLSKRQRNQTLPELAFRIRNTKALHSGLDAARYHAQQRCRLRVHMHQRIHLALAPLTFVLVGIPLGIRSHRKESLAGILLSLAVMFAYYLFIIIADTLDGHPEMMPWLIPWVGVVAAQITGLLFLRHAN